jgi:tetratricopeptide (TPR) repeat protein
VAAARAADPDEWRNRLRDAWERGDRDGLRQLASAARVEELPASTLAGLGADLVALGAPEAVPLLRQAQRRYRGDFRINHGLAQALKQLKPPRLDEAVRFSLAALALRPNSPGALTTFGAALADKGELDEAVVHFNEAIRLKADFAPAHANLGVALFDQGEPVEAEGAFRRAIALRPDYAAAYDNLASALATQGRLAEAADASRRAIALKPDFARSYRGLGRILFGQGKVAESVGALRKAIERDPNDAEVY